MKLLLATAALGMLLFCPDIVMACSCGGKPSVCSAYATADAVFIGTVTRVEDKTTEAEDGRGYLAWQVAYVQVDEAFKGAKTPQLIFRSYGSSCDVHYVEGQRRLFYAAHDKQENSWSIGFCGRSSLLQYAADDLLYLRGLPASAQKTRIAGDVKARDQKPLMGVRVKLIGQSKTYEVFTDKNGVYEAYDLPAGIYVVEPEPPLNMKLSYTSVTLGDVRDRQTVELKDKSCAGINFYFVESTTVGGRVLSPALR